MNDLRKGELPMGELSYLELLNYYSNPTAVIQSFFDYRALQEEGCLLCKGPLSKYHLKAGKNTALQCSKCMKVSYPLVNTPFARTHIPLEILLRVTIEKCIHCSGYSANKIAELFNLSDEASFNLSHRIRSWMQLTLRHTQLDNIVQVDEAALNIGTQGLGRYAQKKRGFGSDTHQPCLGLMDQYGQVILIPIDDREEYTLLTYITQHVPSGYKIVSDDYAGYGNIPAYGYEQHKVNHSKNQYKNGIYSTNRLEGFWSYLKSNYRGTYHQITKKYLDLYLAEYAFRYNNRDLTVHGRLKKLFKSLPPLFDHGNQN